MVNFGFTLLDEGDKAYSPAGNHCLVIFKEPESYQSLKNCLKDIISEVNALSTLMVNGVTFEIMYYLGGDWKFLAIATGIDSVSSTLPVFGPNVPPLIVIAPHSGSQCLIQTMGLVKYCSCWVTFKAKIHF